MIKSAQELARIEKELRAATPEVGHLEIVGHIQDLVPWQVKPEPVEPALRALRRLLHQPAFTDLLPFILEKFNTTVGYTELPSRGRLRNMDRRVFDTYYTPLDLARWLASQTTERVCVPIRQLLISATPEGTLEALRRILQVKICDLSCGAGILLREALEPLVAVYREIYQLMKELGLLSQVEQAPLFVKGLVKLQALLTNVYGVDISAKAVRSARAVLVVWASDELMQSGVTAHDVDRWLRLNIRVGSGSRWRSTAFDARDPLMARSLTAAAAHRNQVRQKAIHGEDVVDERIGDEILDAFPEVFGGKDPGFSCFISNPPFGQLPLNQEDGQLLPSSSCFEFGTPQEEFVRWQYPKFVEALFKLSRTHNSHSAIITPLNLASSREFCIIRGAIERAPRKSTFTFFDRSPDALFGDKVKTRNVVLSVESAQHLIPEIWTTHLMRWTRTNRALLWKHIRTARLEEPAISAFVPKLGTPLEAQSWRLLRNRTETWRSGVVNDSTTPDASVHVYSTAYNWLSAFRRLPSVSNSVTSPGMRTYHFKSSAEADVAYSCLVSGLAFWLWTVESDGFHLTDGFVLDLPLTPTAFSASDAQKLSDLGRLHEQTVKSNPTSKSNAGLNILNFNRQAAAHISHQIDAVIGDALELPPAFLELLRERITGLVYVGRERTRATAS